MVTYYVYASQTPFTIHSETISNLFLEILMIVLFLVFPMFVIVEFKDRQMAVVPLLWLKNENSICLWPKVIKNEEAYEKLVTNLIAPKLNWAEYTIVKVHRILGNSITVSLKLVMKVIFIF